MITFDEMRKIVLVKSMTKQVRDSAIRAKDQSYLVRFYPVVGQLYDSVVEMTKTVDWFIALIERETFIPCNVDDINMAELQERLKRGYLKRNVG
jgi:hypothetical protein